MSQIPIPLIAVISDSLASQYTHTDIDNRFLYVGLGGSPLTGNKVQKCHEGLRRLNAEVADPLSLAGKLIEEIMEVVQSANSSIESPAIAAKERIEKQLATLGLTYIKGGRIVPTGTRVTTKTLEQLLMERDLVGVQHEFERIVGNLEQDPPAAVTAACSLLEALFKSYIADKKLPLPSDQSVLPLWKVIRTHLGLNVTDYEDENLRKILSGIASSIDGIAGLRTNAGSAHGRDLRSTPSTPDRRYRIAPRHARLATHNAMALAIFFIETLEARRA